MVSELILNGEKDRQNQKLNSFEWNKNNKQGQCISFTITILITDITI